MKNIILLSWMLLFLVSCKSKQSLETRSSEVTVQSVSQTLDFLASDNLQGRDTGSPGIEKAAEYIEKNFAEAGLKPFFQSYRDEFEVGDKVGFNIVGYLEGQDEELKNEFILIGAHYDHIGLGKIVAGDSIANGANDNAAGTTVVLELAERLSTIKNNKRSILFALFSAEEKGLLGSKHLAESLKKSNIDLYTVINFEMLGVPLNDKEYEVFLTGFDKSNMASIMNGYAKTNLVGFSEVSKKYNLFMRSDNFPFYKDFNIPSHTISSCDLTNFDYYHHVDDEVDKLNPQFMTDIINKFVPVIQGISNTPTKEITLNEE